MLYLTILCHWLNASTVSHYMFFKVRYSEATFPGGVWEVYMFSLCGAKAKDRIQMPCSQSLENLHHSLHSRDPQSHMEVPFHRKPHLSRVPFRFFPFPTLSYLFLLMILSKYIIGTQIPIWDSTSEEPDLGKHVAFWLEFCSLVLWNPVLCVLAKSSTSQGTPSQVAYWK